METGFNPAPWTPDEQKLLEQGLKTFPASVEDRWEKISAALPNRSKKDCMKRYKVGNRGSLGSRSCDWGPVSLS